MANRGDSNYRRSGASGISPSGDMDETQVFRPVQSSRRSNPNSSRSHVPQNSSYENGGSSYYDGNGYYDGSYDDSYDNYQDASYGSGYQGYEDYADGYDGYEDDGYADYEDGYEPPHQTLAAKASGMANPDPYDRRSSGYSQSSTRRSKKRRSAPRERYDEDYEDYEEPEYQPPRRRKKRHPLRNFLIFLLILVAIFVGIYFMLFRAPTKSQDGIHTRKSGFYNILLCATDEEGARTDTIMIASLDQKNGTCALTSIPRDTIVDSGESVPKINGVYGLAGCGDAGAQALMDQVETLLGFRPDGYAIIDYEIFKDVVDAMGGVTFDVPMDMDVDGTTIYAGEQELSGDLALKVCRYRHGYAMADIQREYVQQTFIKAMVKQCMSPGKLPKLPAIYKAAMSNVITDLDGANIRYLALHILLSGIGDIQQNTLPGEGVNYNGASCYGLYGQSVVDMVNQVMNPYTEDLTIDDVHILTVSGGSLVESTSTGTAFDASTYQYN